MKIISTINEYKSIYPKLAGPIGFVPTMGALHLGHASLLKKARTKCETLVLSIYLNPTQFGKNEDLGSYPKPLEKDLTLAKELNVDIVFTPTTNQIYPNGFSTWVEEKTLSKHLCGKFREGHFLGVTTVVLKLFQILKPHFAVFGLKDAQQFFVLNKIVTDLNLDIKLFGSETIRENNGLALSSRNAYLSKDELQLGSKIYQSLQKIASQPNPLEEIQKQKKILTQIGFNVQYFEALTLPHFDQVQSHKTRSILIAIAAFLGKTRLIDNIILNKELLEKDQIYFI